MKGGDISDSQKGGNLRKGVFDQEKGGGGGGPPLPTMGQYNLGSVVTNIWMCNKKPTTTLKLDIYDTILGNY